MALAAVVYSFLGDTLQAHTKQEDELVAECDDAVAQPLLRAGYVLLSGKLGSQRLVHCFLYETHNLPGSCVVSSNCLLICVLPHLFDVLLCCCMLFINKQATVSGSSHSTMALVPYVLLNRSLYVWRISSR